MFESHESIANLKKDENLRKAIGFRSNLDTGKEP